LACLGDYLSPGFERKSPSLGDKTPLAFPPSLAWLCTGHLNKPLIKLARALLPFI
jgi:hypothetical protein